MILVAALKEYADWIAYKTFEQASKPSWEDFISTLMGGLIGYIIILIQIWKGV